MSMARNPDQELTSAKAVEENRAEPKLRRCTMRFMEQASTLGQSQSVVVPGFQL
jgi:hypothetical protein